MKLLTFLLLAVLAGCVINEDDNADYPSACATAAMDSSGLQRICQQVEMVEGK